MSKSSQHAYTLLMPGDVERLGGIPPRAVVGLLDAKALRAPPTSFSPRTFTPNALFREFLHEVLSQCVFRVEAIRAEARRLGSGYVYLIDRRTADPQGAVPLRDIIGAVGVENGELTVGSYWANPDHRIVSEDGLFQLQFELHECVVEALRKLPPVSSSGDG